MVSLVNKLVLVLSVNGPLKKLRGLFFVPASNNLFTGKSIFLKMTATTGKI